MMSDFFICIVRKTGKSMNGCRQKTLEKTSHGAFIRRSTDKKIY